MKATITVQNLKCGGCAATIIKRLNDQGGISHVEVTPVDSVVQFNYDTLNDLAIAENSLIDLGYPTAGSENKLKNKAMSFISCASGKFTTT
ncbi:MAG: heavy-metal-associated domain-containing protein [Nonlabens sp.]|nr:heavy-metal-associated domain-containing protein [Nonlabens sp.]